MTTIELNSKMSMALVRSNRLLGEAKNYVDNNSIIYEELKKAIQDNERLEKEFDEWWADEEENGHSDESDEEEPSKVPTEVQTALDVLIGVMKKQEQYQVQGAASDQIKINAAQLVLNYFQNKDY